MLTLAFLNVRSVGWLCGEWMKGSEVKQEDEEATSGS